MHAARLNTNTSNEYIEIRPTRFDGENLDCVVTVCLRNWESRQEQSWVTVNADDVGLSLRTLHELQTNLEQWLQSQSVGVEGFSGRFQLGRSPWCKLDLHFAPRADTIASSDKPVVTINLSIGTTLIEFRFVTDQSCLGIFAMSLSQLRPT
jgi:hypothetical protein